MVLDFLILFFLFFEIKIFIIITIINKNKKILQMSKLSITNCINYTLDFLNKNPNLLEYIKNFNQKHNNNRTGFLYNNSDEMKIIRKELELKGYNGYTIPTSLQECENILNCKDEK